MTGSPFRFLRIAVAILCFAPPVYAEESEDPYLGEAVYYARQELYFEALERLDAEIAQHYGVDEPHLDSLAHQIDFAKSI